MKYLWLYSLKRLHNYNVIAWSSKKNRIKFEIRAQFYPEQHKWKKGNLVSLFEDPVALSF